MRKQYNGGCIMIMLKFVLGNFNGKYRRKHKKNRTCLNDNKQSGAHVALETQTKCLQNLFSFFYSLVPTLVYFDFIVLQMISHSMSLKPIEEKLALNHNDVLAVYFLQISFYQILGEKYNYMPFITGLNKISIFKGCVCMCAHAHVIYPSINLYKRLCMLGREERERDRLIFTKTLNKNNNKCISKGHLRASSSRRLASISLLGGYFGRLEGSQA